MHAGSSNDRGTYLGFVCECVVETHAPVTEVRGHNEEGLRVICILCQYLPIRCFPTGDAKPSYFMSHATAAAKPAVFVCNILCSCGAFQQHGVDKGGLVWLAFLP